MNANDYQILFFVILGVITIWQICEYRRKKAIKQFDEKYPSDIICPRTTIVAPNTPPPTKTDIYNVLQGDALSFGFWLSCKPPLELYDKTINDILKEYQASLYHRQD